MANRAHLKRQFLNTWCMCVAYLDRITIRHSLYIGIWDLAYLGKYNLNTCIFHRPVTRQSINTPSATKKRIYVHVEVHNVDNCQ